MADDATMVALIKHSMIGETKPLRTAAAIILDVLRSSDGFDGFTVKFATIEADHGRAVADEIRSLMQEHGLGTPLDLEP